MSVRMKRRVLAPSSVTCDCLPGYRLIECLNQSRWGETWKAQSPNGKEWAIRFVYGFSRTGASGSLDLMAVSRLKFMKHPHLLEVEEVINDQGRMVFVTPLWDQSLRDRFRECQKDRLPGIPRPELLEYLHGAALALDSLGMQHKVWHLGINPRNLFLAAGQLKIGEFGILHLLWANGKKPLAPHNPAYAAPELFQGKYGPSSDQFSLALIYHELLTGHHPYGATNLRQMVENRLHRQPDLDLLSTPERAPMLQALAADPSRRFGSNVAFVEALRDATAAREGRSKRRSRQPAADSQAEASSAREISLLAPALVYPPGQLEQLVQTLVQTAAESMQVKEFRGLRYRITPEGVLRHKCSAWLPGAIARRKLEGFLNNWHAEVVQSDAESVLFHLTVEQGFLRRVLAGGNRIEVEVRLNRHGPETNLTDVTISMKFLGWGRQHGLRLVEEVGPQLLQELHTHLLASPERRIQERFDFPYPLRVVPARAGDSDLFVEGIAKDVSATGIGFYTPHEVPKTEMVIEQTVPGRDEPIRIPVEITRFQAKDNGWYEAGARFLIKPGNA